MYSYQFSSILSITNSSIVATVGYELLENNIDEAEQLAKDYIDVEEKKFGITSDFVL